MKLLVLLSLLALASAAVLKMDLQRRRSPLARRAFLANRRFNPNTKAASNQGLSLTDEDICVANITIGTPPQTFRVQVKTARAELIVYDSSCAKCDREEPKNKFNSSVSSTYVNDGRPIEGFFDIKGFLGKDTMRFGGVGDEAITVKDQIFGQATKFALNFPSMDGYLGLAFPAEATEGFVPPLFNAINQGLLDMPIFTIWVQNGEGRNGQITYGGLDTDHCGDLVAYQSLTSAKTWKFHLKSVTAGAFSSNEGWEAEISVELGLINGPEGVIGALAHSLGATFKREYFAYVLPCDTEVPAIVFGIGSNQYQIDPSYLKLEENGICYLPLSGLEFAILGPVWSIGAPLIYQYCSIFDIGQQRIGFAPNLKQ